MEKNSTILDLIKSKKEILILYVVGNSSFSPHFTTVHLIGSRNARATITFSSEDYITLQTHSQQRLKIVLTHAPKLLINMSRGAN